MPAWRTKRMSDNVHRSWRQRIRLFFKNNLRYFAVKDLFKIRMLFLILRVWPYTMVGYPRLKNLYELSVQLEKESVPGAFVECGVWKGGCAALMGLVAKRFGGRRTLWFFDSFEGLPEPTAMDGEVGKAYSPGKQDGKLQSIQQLIVDKAYVERLLFETFGLSPEKHRVIQGWFQNSLPSTRNEIGPIALLRLDGDWYESIRCCLEMLYDQVGSGGIIMIDDYKQFEGCRRAVDEFLEKRGIHPLFHSSDHVGIYFRKP